MPIGISFFLKKNPAAFLSIMSQYTEFQEWLNECPVKITRYEDFTDFFEVTFEVPLENDEDD